VIVIELRGLLVPGRHGAYPEEREQERDFLYDVTLAVGERGVSDRLEDAVDYDAVARCVAEVGGGGPFHLLEALAAAVADELVTRFGAERAVVRVTKPGIRPGGVAAEAVSVTASRP
jgi:7,8-dihydroneopterin aldolase/epimerase/oxygenase